MADPTQQDVNDFLAMLAAIEAEGGAEAVIDFGATQGIIETNTAQQMREAVAAGGNLDLGGGQPLGAMGEPLPHGVYEWAGEGPGGDLWGGQQITLKDTSLISVTGLVEIMRQSYIAAGSTRDPLFFYSFAAVLYLLLTFVSMKLINKLEVKYSRGY